MSERTANKTYIVDWTARLSPSIRLMTADEIARDPDQGQSISRCREEIVSHFKLIILHARGEIQRARFTPKYVIEEGKYR